jgi:predicted lactoylglutathione lyase
MELIHTCYRITEIDRSVAFYEALGFEERGGCRSATRRSTSSWACPATPTGSS